MDALQREAILDWVGLPLLRILSEERDPKTAICFSTLSSQLQRLDGPVGELLGAIIKAKQIVRKRGGNLTIIASVCGTDGDPQDMTYYTL